MTNKDIKSNMDVNIDIALTSFNNDVDEVNIRDESTAPLCNGIPRRLWVGKCMILHEADRVVVAKGISCKVSSDIMVGSKGPLGDNHVAVQICSNLSIADVLDDWRYSI